MTTVGSLAYSIVANTQNFTAGVAASKAELRTLKDAFMASQTPVERFSMAIEHLEAMAQKFPDKAAGINRTIAQMRTEMTAGSDVTAHAAHGTDEFTHAMDRMNTRMGRMMLSEVMGTLREIPGAMLAVEIAFGNWLGAAIHGLMLAHELMKETQEAVTKTADAYESATDKVVKFYEEEQRAREKGRARDRVGGLPGEVEKSADELGMGKLGYAASNTMAGKGQRFATWLNELSAVFTGIGDRPGAEHERAVELGTKNARDEMESRKLAANEHERRENEIKNAQEVQQEFDKYLALRRHAVEEEYHIEQQHVKEIEKTRLDAINRANELAGKAYDANEKKAESIANSQMSGAEKLREEFTKLQELQAGGFFDLHPGAYEGALQDLKDKAADMAGGGDFKGITSAVQSASAEGIAARFGSQGNGEKQIRELQKANAQRSEANTLLGDIKTAILNQPAMGVVE